MPNEGTVPNPGSREAVTAGCTCAVKDNYHGDGFMWRGQRVFWMTVDCPLHGTDARARARERTEVPAHEYVGDD